MRFHHVQLIMLTVVVIFCLAFNWIASTRQNPPVIHDIPTVVVERLNDKCPPCELFFRRLESTGKNGKLVQDVKVQQRGEPKSGTSFMYDWATATLIRTCDYMQYFFGEGSCRIELKRKGEEDDQQLGRAANRIMVFEPARGSTNARCPCETVERVSIVLSDADKHTLPVSPGCAYHHARGIDVGPMKNGVLDDKNSCHFMDGRQVTSQHDLWQCMHEADCAFLDDWLQMAVFRDPRPAVVSSYFHLKRISKVVLPSLEEFLAMKLPIMCQWLAVRYTLFSGSQSHQSTEFWYRKALASPLGWHHTWFDMVGLQLPFNIVNATANGAVNYDFKFNKKHIDEHPGEEATSGAGPRRFEDQVSQEVLRKADEVLRVWLPPVLLEQLGVAPKLLEVAAPHVAVMQRQLKAEPSHVAVVAPPAAATPTQRAITPLQVAIGSPQVAVPPPQPERALPRTAVASAHVAAGPIQHVAVVKQQLAVAQPTLAAQLRQRKVAPPQLNLERLPLAVAKLQPVVALPQRAVALQVAAAPPRLALTPPLLVAAMPQFVVAPPQLAALEPSQRAVATPRLVVEPAPVAVADPHVAVAPPQRAVVPNQGEATPPQLVVPPPQLEVAHRSSQLHRHISP